MVLRNLPVIFAIQLITVNFGSALKITNWPKTTAVFHIKSTVVLYDDSIHKGHKEPIDSDTNRLGDS